VGFRLFCQVKSMKLRREEEHEEGESGPCPFALSLLKEFADESQKCI
jgi:hypothetical protein